MLLLAVGCSGSSTHKAIPTTTTAPSPATREQIVDMVVSSLPESPAFNRRIIRAHWSEVVARLPMHLPAPIAQRKCESGNVLLVKLRDGSEITYECQMPHSIRVVIDFMISVVVNASTLQARADRLCRRAVPEPAKLVSSYPTTVGDIRNITIGSTAPSRTPAFPSRPAGEFGAWCWIRLSPHDFNVYKVTSGVNAVLAAHLPNFNPRNAHGAPAIP